MNAYRSINKKFSVLTLLILLSCYATSQVQTPENILILDTIDVGSYTLNCPPAVGPWKVELDESNGTVNFTRSKLWPFTGRQIGKTYILVYRNDVLA